MSKNQVVIDSHEFASKVTALMKTKDSIKSGISKLEKSAEVDKISKKIHELEVGLHKLNDYLFKSNE